MPWKYEILTSFERDYDVKLASCCPLRNQAWCVPANLVVPTVVHTQWMQESTLMHAVCAEDAEWRRSHHSIDSRRSLLRNGGCLTGRTIQRGSWTGDLPGQERFADVWPPWLLSAYMALAWMNSSLPAVLHTAYIPEVKRRCGNSRQRTNALCQSKRDGASFEDHVIIRAIVCDFCWDVSGPPSRLEGPILLS